jgi:hypothetical protein
VGNSFLFVNTKTQQKIMLFTLEEEDEDEEEEEGGEARRGGQQQEIPIVFWVCVCAVFFFSCLSPSASFCPSHCFLSVGLSVCPVS